MDQGMLVDHYIQAERHVTEGERHIAHQQHLVAHLENHGHDTRQARKTLRQFEELQALHIADRDRLKRELGQ